MSNKFDKIVSNIRQQKQSSEKRNQDLDLLGRHFDNDIPAYIEEAIKLYESNSGPKKRKNDITEIRKIFAVEDPNPKQIEKQLRNYFQSTSYVRGMLGRSHLEDCVHAALFLYKERQINIIDGMQRAQLVKVALEKAIISLKSRKILKNDTPDNILNDLDINTKDLNQETILLTLNEHLSKTDAKSKEAVIGLISKSLRKLEPYASYANETISYDFKTVVQFAINQYRDIKPDMSEAKEKNIEDILAILNAGESNEQIKTNIKHYLNDNFGLFDGSRLEKYINRALDNFNPEQSERNIHLKIWNKEGVFNPQDVKPGRKVVLAIHGLQDSVDTFNELANQYVDNDYEVVSYDQHGHGYDENRNASGVLNIQQMQFDFYKMAQKYINDDSVVEVIIVGHGLGGSIVSNSLKTLEHSDNSEKIKKIQLIAPAAMQNPIVELISSLPTILFNSGDKSESVAYTRSQGLSRSGGPGILSALREFIDFVANAFDSLRNVLTRQKEAKFPIEIHYAEDDKLVYAGNFKRLSTLAKDANKEPQGERYSFLNKAQGGHHFHGSGSKTTPDFPDEAEDKNSNKSGPR